MSSECGIPALICYVALIGLCLGSNFRMHRRTRDFPGLDDVAGLSLCLLAGTLVYETSAFFFHIAYSSHLPLLSGATAALELAARPMPGSGEGEIAGRRRLLNYPKHCFV